MSSAGTRKSSPAISPVRHRVANRAMRNSSRCFARYPLEQFRNKEKARQKRAPKYCIFTVCRITDPALLALAMSFLIFGFSFVQPLLARGSALNKGKRERSLFLGGRRGIFNILDQWFASLFSRALVAFPFRFLKFKFEIATGPPILRRNTRYHFGV